MSNKGLLHAGIVGERVVEGVGEAGGADRLGEPGLRVGSVVGLAVDTGMGVSAVLRSCAEFGARACIGTSMRFVAAAVETPAQPSIHEGSTCGSLHRSVQSDGSRLSDPVQSFCTRAVLRGYSAILVVLSDPLFSFCALLGVALTAKQAIGSPNRRRRSSIARPTVAAAHALAAGHTRCAQRSAPRMPAAGSTPRAARAGRRFHASR